jgi:transposase
MMYAVVKRDGTFAGRCCETIEAARELACQESGRRVYALTENRDTETINSVLESFESMLESIECPTMEYDCPYYKRGLCTLENAEMECDAFYSEE